MGRPGLEGTDCLMNEVEIVVADNFRESFPGIMGVLPSEAVDVVRHPDAHEVVEVGADNSIRVHLSVRRPSDDKPYYLLVLDRDAEDDTRVLHDAFRFQGDLCDDVKGKSPLELLTAVADRFAYLVAPKGEAKKLLIQERVPCAPSEVDTDTIIRMMMPIDMNKGDEVLGTQYVMYDASAEEIVFAVAFVWNVTRYRDYLAGAG